MSREEARRDRDEANRKIDELDPCFPSTIDPSMPYQPLPQAEPRTSPSTPPPPSWLTQLAEAKDIFRVCEDTEDDDRLHTWIHRYAQSAAQAKTAIQDADTELLDIGNTDQEFLVEIAERCMETAVREMKEANDLRWRDLQKDIDTYFQEKRKRAGSPAIAV